MNVDELMSYLQGIVSHLTLEERVRAPDIYIALRAITMSLERAIEAISGPAALASFQRLAYENSLWIKTQEVHADGSPTSPAV